MARVAGVDGAPGGRAVVTVETAGPRWQVLRVKTVAELAVALSDAAAIAVDIPIGLPSAYQIGGRNCDRAARAILGARASSVFPAPLRDTLQAESWEEACAMSRSSGAGAKGLSKQLYGILPKVKEVDDFLQPWPELRNRIYEVHPELCFYGLSGAPMAWRKTLAYGKDERRRALRPIFADIDRLERAGRAQDLPTADTLDAAVACWSALRLYRRKARRVSAPQHDATGLPMAIWF